MGGGEAALGWAGVEKRRGQLDGEVERRHGNGGGCGSWAREQGPASAFMGEQGEGEGDGRGQGVGQLGQRPRRSAGRGCRRAWRARRSGESARAACTLEWG